MTQKLTAGAAILAALIIAAAIVYHGRELGKLSGRLAAMEQRTSELDGRLQKFSSDLPAVVGQAGRNAGQQAVHGMVEEAFVKPLGWMKPALAHGASNLLKSVTSELSTNGLGTNFNWSMIRFDIPQPVVNIAILPNLKKVPAFPWLGNESKPPAGVSSNRP